MNSSYYDQGKDNLGLFGGCIFERVEEDGSFVDIIVKDSIF